jgi:hypothetical protein
LLRFLLSRAVEVLLEGGLDFGQGVEPGEECGAVLAVVEAGVELVEDGFGEVGDFAVSVHVVISGFIVITVYCGNYVTGGEKPKTYRRFFGTIFAESFWKRKGLRGNGLRIEKG